MSEFKVHPKTLRGYINCLSGLFMTKSNPQGLTPTECALLSVLLSVLPEGKEIDKPIKIEVANMTNNKVQVVTNYITKFMKKGVVVDRKLHPVFYKDQITITYGS
jgi:hypothetical protein